MLNHSSEEHDWFKESRSSVDNPKRNWYHWAKGTVDKDGNKCPPNNWESIFKGSAWEYDDLTDEWYLHLFVKQQPDFNWDNPELREALYDIARFWLDRGCDGFRVSPTNAHRSRPPSDLPFDSQRSIPFLLSSTRSSL